MTKLAEVDAMRIAISLIFLLMIFEISPLMADDPGFPGGDPDVPIDGGVLVLLIAGACYGLKKIRSNGEGRE